MKKIWFKRKTYGWGWQPATWQGWIVTMSFLAFVIVHGFMIEQYIERLASLGIFLWSLGLLCLVIALIIVCYMYGESPRWQWGKK